MQNGRCTKCEGVTPLNNYCVFDDGTVFGYDGESCYPLNNKDKEQKVSDKVSNGKKSINKLMGKP
jgi:hypothetical protein